VRIFDLPHAMQQLDKMPPGVQAAALAAPFAIAAVAIMITGSVVSVFYCLGTLNNERRDRSILFWKSLPVSDTTAVLAKAFVPFVVLPVVTFVVVLATQFVMMLLATVALTIDGISPGVVWTHWQILRMTLLLIYIIVASILWYAPIIGWLLMVSSWARRMAFLWAVLPLPGLAILEKIAFDTTYVGDFINYRINGWVQNAFVPMASFKNHHGHMHMNDIPVIDPLTLMAPGHYLATPGLWLGLLAAAAFIAAAIYFRRMRDPG
jgi:ABC-2 type transport system permease protein